MIIFIQLCIFLAVFAFRGRYLIGRHLSADKKNPHHLHYVSTNKGSTVARDIGITQKGSIPFIIKKERWYHRTLKNLGMATELRVYDEALSKKYFFATDFPNHLERAMSSGPLLKHWQTLFALPIKSLHATQGRLWCVIDKADLEKPDEHFKQHYELLESISKATTAPPSAAVARTSLRLGTLALLCLCVHAGLVTFGIVGPFLFLVDSLDTVQDRELVYKGLFFGGVAVAGWCFLITTLFNRSSWMSWVMADFVLFGIVGIMLSSVYVAREANIRLPQPEAHSYPEAVLKKECVLKCKKRCGKNCTRTSEYPFESARYCHPLMRPGVMQEYKQRDSICRSSAKFVFNIYVNSWRNDPFYKFEAASMLFDQVNLGSYLSVPVHSGAIGLEWVDTEQITPR